MAKRRRLETPSADDLSRIEAEFRDETQAHRGRGVAPIATVVADSAGQSDPDLPEQRAERARTEADATRYRDARERGLLVVEIPVAEIDEKAMIRDRTVIEEEDQIELRNSIAAGGLRMPVEVFETGQADGQGARYGLLSGYRRLRAVRDLAAMTGGETFTTIRAIVRPQAEADRAYVQMVEENEVRADLSNFERGRIAVIAAMQGAFPDTQAAVNALFASGSKAKRSKVRSFALIFEELGDMLAFPESLTETRGLRLGTALRGGNRSARRTVGTGAAGRGGGMGGPGGGDRAVGCPGARSQTGRTAQDGAGGGLAGRQDNPHEFGLRDPPRGGFARGHPADRGASHGQGDDGNRHAGNPEAAGRVGGFVTKPVRTAPLPGPRRAGWVVRDIANYINTLRNSQPVRGPRTVTPPCRRRAIADLWRQSCRRTSVLRVENSYSASHPFSRPKPDFFMPPKGSSMPPPAP